MRRGITLVETIVAVTVLTMALGGPFLMAARSLKVAGYAREEVAAARLAEEGLEIVHSMRDNNSAESDTGRAWDKGINDCALGCYIDVTKQLVPAANQSIWDVDGLYPSVVDCNGACPNEKFRVYMHTSGFYRQFDLAEYGGNPQGGYSKTNMTRMVRITPVSGTSREYLVESIVTYYAGPTQRTIQLSDTILNWFPSMETLL